MSSMGSLESSLLTAAAVGAFAALYFFGGKPPGETPTVQQNENVEKGGKKKNRKKGGAGAASTSGTTASDASPSVDESISSLPGSMTKMVDSMLSESDLNASGKETSTKPKKRKNKGSKATTPASSILATSKSKLGESTTTTQPPNRGLSASSRLLESTESLGTADEGWTRISRTAGSRSGANHKLAADQTSDAGVITASSVTGTEDEDVSAPKTLAEKLLPKPAKTEVDDMLEGGSQPQLARVMRVVPTTDRPVSGFSWGDYEDGDEVRRSAGAESDEDDGGGWSSVKSRSRRPPRDPSTASQQQTTSSTTASTKKQRQNAVKRDARKVAKAEAESERLATLAKHKRELEKLRMEEQFKHQGKAKSTVSGGMKATIDENGKLVWE